MNYPEVIGYAVMCIGGAAVVLIGGWGVIVWIAELPPFKKKVRHIMKLGMDAYRAEERAKSGGDIK